ncbi:unnamed protein product [Ostreobium quekettii]|uniref:Glycolipid transfer protein domain-containing protein n=1 Tax=Ostreobium quekettii TaxID=121088 RepID=A0A8S1J5C0_9CHLO|nr:unnamed protein product [Ostreobium quekettii]
MQQKKTVTKKNSCARNLHRLRSAILFVSTLVQELTSDSSMSLREAASTAYESALAPIHTYVVRGAVKAGLLMLPSRAAFLASICETETTARGHTEKLVAVANEMIRAIDSLYDVPMPASNTWFISA